MKIFRIALLSTALLFVYLVKAQKEDNLWVLGTQISGNNCGITFDHGIGDTISVFTKLRFFNSDASICDSSGQLLFYTNGVQIFNKYFDTLFNSQNFNPGWATNYYLNSGMGITQCVIILNKPGHMDKYLIFHMSAELLPNSEVQPLNLSYSEIDMILDNGNGGIDNLKNIHIIDDTLILGKTVACRHANGRDWWVLCHKYNSDVYYKLLITPDTIINFQQQIGSTVPYQSDGYGQMVFSPDGNKFVFAIQNNISDIFSFDRCNGNLNLLETISNPDTIFGLGGCSISPNSQFLYINNSKEIYQYNLNSGNISTSEKLIAVWDTFYSPASTIFFQNQLAPDGKIYISTFAGTDRLHVINSPDLVDTACNFVQNQIVLPSGNICLPNFPNFRLGALTGSICDTLHIGINEISSTHKNFNLYPNPARDKLTVSYDQASSSEAELLVYDIVGKIVFKIPLNKESKKEIDVSKLSNGIYNCILIVDEKQIDEIKLSIIK